MAKKIPGPVWPKGSRKTIEGQIKKVKQGQAKGKITKYPKKLKAEPTEADYQALMVWSYCMWTWGQKVVDTIHELHPETKGNPEDPPPPPWKPGG